MSIPPHRWATRKLSGMSAPDDPFEQLAPYMPLLWFEFMLRRAAGLDPMDAVIWSLRRILPKEGLHETLAVAAFYSADPLQEIQATIVVETIANVGEEMFQKFRKRDDWRPGVDGLPW